MIRGKTYGDRQKALALREKVYALRCKVLGEDHLQTLSTRNSIEEVKKKLSQAN